MQEVVDRLEVNSIHNIPLQYCTCIVDKLQALDVCIFFGTSSHSTSFACGLFIH